jgi:hypothetical protein
MSNKHEVKMELSKEELLALEDALLMRVSSLKSRAAPGDYVQATKLETALECVQSVTYWLPKSE